jgi:hypothetical protein
MWHCRYGCVAARDSIVVTVFWVDWIVRGIVITKNYVPFNAIFVSNEEVGYVCSVRYELSLLSARI